MNTSSFIVWSGCGWGLERVQIFILPSGRGSGLLQSFSHLHVDFDLASLSHPHDCICFYT